jgi:SAM-dependent methyltransferase
VNDDQFEHLISVADAQQLSGWDWSHVKGRYIESEPPWNYRDQVQAHIQPKLRLLDMGTGGGELLESLAPLPSDTWATEGYPPNVPIAQARLGPLGVRVVPIEGDLLPLADATFDLVTNRHESFDAREVQRVLRPGGTFITQQVGAQDLIELNEALQDKTRFAFPEWKLSSVRRQLETTGLQVLVAENAFPEAVFTDIGAVVFFLKVTPWQIEDFSCDRYREQLRLLHQRTVAEGGFRVHTHRFLLIARKP